LLRLGPFDLSWFLRTTWLGKPPAAFCLANDDIRSIMTREEPNDTD
jgi:hypothetical protein